MLPNRIAKPTIREALTESWVSLRGFILTFWISALISIAIVISFYLPMIANHAPQIIKNFFLQPFTMQSHSIAKLLYLLGSLSAVVFFMGLKLQAVNNMQNKSAEIKQLFIFFKKPLFLTLVALLFNLTNILALFNLHFVLLSFIFFTLVFILFFLQFADTLIIKKQLKVTTACSLSFSTVRKNFWLITGCNFAVFAIFVLLSSIFIFHPRFWTMILFSIGLILFFPFVANVYGYLYKKIFMEGESN